MSIADRCRERGIRLDPKRAKSIAVHLHTCGVRIPDDRDMADGLIVNWLASLDDLDDEQFSSGLRNYWRTDQPFRHDPAAFRKAAGVRAMTDEERAIAAWQVVHSAIRSYGYSTALTFDDAPTNYTLERLGGFGRLCETPADQIQWVRRDFIATYQSAAARRLGSSRAYIPAFDGSASNDAPLVIGCKLPRLECEMVNENNRPRIEAAEGLLALPVELE